MNGSEGYMRDDVSRFLSAMEGNANAFEPGDDLAQARAAFAAMLQEHDIPARPTRVSRSFTCPGPTGPIPLRLYDAAADGRVPRPVIVYFHGGGFMLGDLACYAGLCGELALLTGLPVVAVDYRLAPEHPFPAAPDDCEAAARWIAQEAATLGITTNGLVLMGDSAGGNLAIVTAQALASAPAALPVLLHAPVYPVAGPIARHDSYRTYREGHLLTREALMRFHVNYAAPLDDPRHYPLLRTDWKASPPALVVTAQYDPLRDSGREYAAKLTEAGIACEAMEISGMVHGFMTLRKAIPSAQSDLEAITRAMTRMLERPS